MKKKKTKQHSLITNIEGQNNGNKQMRKNTINIPSIVAASISGATGGIVLGSVIASVTGAVICGFLGSAITAYSSYTGNINKGITNGKS